MSAAPAGACQASCTALPRRRDAAVSSSTRPSGATSPVSVLAVGTVVGVETAGADGSTVGVGGGVGVGVGSGVGSGAGGGGAAVAVPVRAAVSVPAPPVVSCRVADLAPAAVGVNATVALQLPPAGT